MDIIHRALCLMLLQSPGPCAYTASNRIGSKCPTKKAVPSYSMRERTDKWSKGSESLKLFQLCILQLFYGIIFKGNVAIKYN